MVNSVIPLSMKTRTSDILMIMDKNNFYQDPGEGFNT